MPQNASNQPQTRGAWTRIKAGLPAWLGRVAGPRRPSPSPHSISPVDPHLRAALAPAADRLRRVWFGWSLALNWLVMAALGLGLFALKPHGLQLSPRALGGFALVGLVAVLFIARRIRQTDPDWNRLARRIETRFPELEGLLLTAVQQQTARGRRRHYLQERLIRATLARAAREPWRKAVGLWRIGLAQTAHLLALAAFALVLWQLHLPLSPAQPAPYRPPRITGESILPGDTRLERGTPLVVLAHLGTSARRNVQLVIRESGEPERSQAMNQSLADPVFGARVPDVTRDLTYRVEYDGHRTRDFRVTVYEHPRLERADADLTYPAYTRQSMRRLPDTRRLSAVEGTRLNLELLLNKPVAAARLLPRDDGHPTIELAVQTNHPAATLVDFVLDRSQTYQLQLVDADGLTNKIPAPFVFEVAPNRPPEFKLTAPRGDSRPSPLEELVFTGTVGDDFGVEAFGLAYSLVGEAPRFINLGGGLTNTERRPFKHLLPLEELGVQPDQLLTWFTWADDLGPTGQLRRTLGDLFFAEIRPFEESFREADNGASEPSTNSQDRRESGEGAPGRLAELQKQILTATWKLQRDSTAAYRENATVVRDSQAQVISQAEAARDEVLDPQTLTLWTPAIDAMLDARGRLADALDNPTVLPKAVPPEQAAYQALLRLQQHEFAVSRSRSQPGASQNPARQRQLDQLDLTQSENRYETERRAQPADNPARREEVQILNRLQELARRQQDINDQLRELQTALQETRQANERDNARRQLERLQDQQRQMLADLDELQQRLRQSTDADRRMDQSRRLDDARQNLERAAEAVDQARPSQALAAGTRAADQLKQMREELRRDTASAAATDLREMRTQARDLARRQAAIDQKLDGLDDPRRRTLDDATDRQELLKELEPQPGRLQELVDRATAVSTQTETAEPLVSRELYDAVRRFSQTEDATARQLQEELLERGLMTRRIFDKLTGTNATSASRSLEVATELLRQGQVPIAQRTEERSRISINDLTQGIERAAERVLGDDAQALQRAQRELDQLASEVQREIGLDDAPPGSANPTAGEPTDAPRTPTQQPGPPSADRSSSGPPPEGNNQARGESRQPALENLLPGNNNTGGGGPIIGGDFTSWSDRLREVEDMVDLPDLRNDIANARDRAREFRLEYRRAGKKPDWAVVRLQVVRPLVEVRDQIAQELARRQPEQNLVPLDRDPVPSSYAERVRRYYEALSRETQGPATPQPRSSP